MNNFLKKTTDAFFRNPGWPSKRSARLSGPRLNIIILAVCIAFALTNVLIIVRAFKPRPPGHSFWGRAPATVIPRPSQQRDSIFPRRLVISRELMDQLELLTSNDSLLRARPKLLDSIRRIKDFYQSQQKR